jgi:hypothetical protein
MPFTHLRGDSHFNPTLLEAMRKAFDDACGQLDIEADNPLASMVATDIISLAAGGERDADILAKRAIENVKRLPRTKRRALKWTGPSRQ